MWPHSFEHPPRDRPIRNEAIFANGLSQNLQLAAKVIQHRYEPRARRVVSGFDLAGSAERFNDQVNRAVVHVQAAAVRKESDLRPGVHFSLFPVASGHGFFALAARCLRPSSSRLMEASGRTWSM